VADKEVMQMALDAFETHAKQYPHMVKGYTVDAAQALRVALAQPEPVAMKFQTYKQTPPRGGELKPINSALLPWVYDQDPSSGNTASMWVTPVATLPPQREWVGLTDEEILADDVLRYHFALNGGAGPISKKGKAIIEAIEAKLKEKNT